MLVVEHRPVVSAHAREVARERLVEALRARFGLEPDQYATVSSVYIVTGSGPVVDTATIVVRGRALRLRRDGASYLICRLDGLVKVPARTRFALDLLIR